MFSLLNGLLGQPLDAHQPCEPTNTVVLLHLVDLHARKLLVPLACRHLSSVTPAAGDRPEIGVFPSTTLLTIGGKRQKDE